MTAGRSIGVWALTGLMVNNMIGSGIFGVPGELVRLLGRASPLASVIAGLSVAVIVACFLEVSSQFSESGGPYLYVRTAFGRLLGIQVAWFTALAPIAAAAAQATLFVSYLAGFAPALGSGAGRVITLVFVIGLPVIANLIGVRAGKNMSSALVVAKLVPLAVLMGAGLFFLRASETTPAVVMTAAPLDMSVWFGAVLIASFSYGGFENALAATGEVRNPRRFVPLALAISLGICIVVNTLLQWVTSRALSDAQVIGDRPLAAAAAVVLGPGGATLISVAALISCAGAIAATVLAIPRLLAALSEHGDFPALFARSSARGSPVIATLAVAAIVITLSITGTFRWALAVTAGSMTIFAGAVCAALPRLRRLQPGAATFHVPGGPVLAIVGVALSVLLLLQLEAGEALAIAITMAIALLNWLRVRGSSR